MSGEATRNRSAGTLGLSRCSAALKPSSQGTAARRVRQRAKKVSQAFTESIAPRRKAPNGVLLSPAKGRERTLRAAVPIAPIAQKERAMCYNIPKCPRTAVDSGVLS